VACSAGSWRAVRWTDKNGMPDLLHSRSSPLRPTATGTRSSARSSACWNLPAVLRDVANGMRDTAGRSNGRALVCSCFSVPMRIAMTRHGATAALTPEVACAVPAVSLDRRSASLNLVTVATVDECDLQPLARAHRAGERDLALDVGPRLQYPAGSGPRVHTTSRHETPAAPESPSVLRPAHSE
jgi:hypothetical protein